jgi:WD40 repeat protein
MTQQKHRKALIRARMARTGEAYTAARRHVVSIERLPGLTGAGSFRAHDRHCQVVVFLPDDRHLLSGGFGGEARIWTLDGERVGELVGHEASVNAILLPREARWPSRPRRIARSAAGTCPLAGSGLCSGVITARSSGSPSTRDAAGSGAVAGIDASRRGT